MILSEILKDLNLQVFIDLEDPKSLSATYKVGDEEMQGVQCVANMVAETIKRGYNLKIDKIINMGESAEFTEGPEKLLEIHYVTKIVNEIAYKYKVLTKDVTMDALHTWEGYLRSNIFYSIMNNPEAVGKLKEFELNEFMPVWKKQNPDYTTTNYEYRFYKDEKQSWINPERLKMVSFDKGHVKLKLVMPVKEEKAIPETKEI